MDFIDLFAGVGGFHHALSHPAFGGECVLAVEWDPSCRLVYERAFPDLEDARFESDVRSITRLPNGDDAPLAAVDQAVPDHDVLCAGVRVFAQVRERVSPLLREAPRAAPLAGCGR